MRNLFAVLAVGALAVAGQGSAATLTASSLSFQMGALPAALFPGVGATGTATSNLSASLGAGTVFNGAFTTTIPTSAAPPITAIQVIISKNAGQTFSGTAPSKVGGNLAVEGVFNWYVAGGAGLLISVPLKIGTPNTAFKSNGGLSVTAIAAGWTVGTASVMGVDVTTTTTPTGTMTNMFTATSTAMGANGLTPGGAGTLVLVTPIKINSNIKTFAAFSVLSLTYVPEPGTLLLLGMGVASLAALGRRKRRSTN
jgi:PEP-CTERM motif